MASAQDVDTAQATVQGYEKVLAPFSGVVAARLLDPGAFIQNVSGSTSSQPILTLSDLARLRVSFFVDQDSAARIQVGQDVAVSPAEHSDQASPARFSRVSGTLDVRTPTMLAEADLDNLDGRFLGGGDVRVELRLPVEPGRIEIPANTLLLREEKPYAAVLEGGPGAHGAPGAGPGRGQPGPRAPRPRPGHPGDRQFQPRAEERRPGPVPAARIVEDFSYNGGFGVFRMKRILLLLALSSAAFAQDAALNFQVKFLRVLMSSCSQYGIDCLDAATKDRLEHVGLNVGPQFKLGLATTEAEVKKLKAAGKLVVVTDSAWLADGGGIAVTNTNGKPQISINIANVKASGMVLSDTLIKMANGNQ